MKKLFSALVISSMTVIFSVPVANAARQNAITFAIPGDTDIYVEFNPQESNPVSAFIQELIDQNRESDSIFMEPGNVIAEEIINSSQVAISLKMVPSEYYGPDLEGYIFIQNSPAGHDQFIEDLREANQAIEDYFNDFTIEEVPTPVDFDEPTTEPIEISIGEPNEPAVVDEPYDVIEPIEIPTIPEIPESEEYKGHTIHNIDYNAITHLDGKYTVITDDAETIKKLIDWYQSSDRSPLSNTPSFIQSETDFLPNSFANFYLSGKVYEQIMTEANNITFEDDETIKLQAKMFDALSLSVEQDELNKHNIEFQALLNKEVKEKLELAPEKYDFIPRFAREFSHNDLIFFAEEYNLSGQIQEAYSIIENTFNDLGGDFPFAINAEEINAFTSELFGITLSDLENVASQHSAFAIYDNNAKFPGITATFNVTSHNDEAEMLAKKVQSWLYENIPTDVTMDTTFIDGVQVPTLEFEGPFGEPMHIVVGVAANNLIISSDLDIKENYGQGGIGGTYNNYSTINSFTYFNARNASPLISTFLQEEEDYDMATANEIAKIATAPFGPMSFTSIVDGNKLKTEGTIEFDPQKLLEYEAIAAMAFQRAFDATSEMTFTEEESFTNDFPSQFCDVATLSNQDQQAIKELQYADIIKGNPDGCFYPEKTINRAEFITLIDRAFPLAETESTNDFSDVPADAWFADAVNKAVSAGIIKGHPDGTFRPADPINLAEATAILHRIKDGQLDILQTDLPYTDINESDWFYGDISYGYQTGILPAADQIMPGKKINRAEAAQFIHRAIWQYSGLY